MTRASASSIVSMKYRRSKLFRRLNALFFAESREGRSSEIAAWSNALASIAIGVAIFLRTHSWPFAICLPIIVFGLLRGALAHRFTLWIAAAAGTLAVAAVGGGLAWLFAHVIEAAWVPAAAAALGAAISALLPAWAYSRLSQRRIDQQPDSLIEPVSVPPSRE
jgi:hypothetical protein